MEPIALGSGENSLLHHLKALQNWGHEGKAQPLNQSQKGNLSGLESSLKGWKSCSLGQAGSTEPWILPRGFSRELSAREGTCVKLWQVGEEGGGDGPRGEGGRQLCVTQTPSALGFVLETETKILAKLERGTTVCDAGLGTVAALAGVN